ncbi:hypothetical protein HCY58_13755 [Acinetobacter radioresistens]|uniref:zonular occludens toxin domain-containing protein n=1 Tax=Acinetobacter radioresistens TaxID=40216 RepID=UPI00200401AB|nr:zonular occludens toxin domain-containing protein [Acinetobacter radioresistens]MCK4088107.1 hypothetical protein [Acinetobacter radioresistens]
MLTAISAPPGSGKSLWCVELLETTVRKNPNRMVFTNIIGINIPGVLPITSSTNKPFDWRDLPDGSLIVFDEAHEHPSFSKTDLLKNYQLPRYINDLYDNEISKILDYVNLPIPLKVDLLNKHGFVYTELPLALKVKEQEQLILKIRNLQKMALEKAKEDILDIGRALTMHRHFGFDIVLVTQKPDLLNSFVKAATSEHLILRRLFKMQLAIIYSYSEIQDSFGNATRKNSLSWKIWFFPKRLFKYYISAEQHTAKAALPWGLKVPILLFMCLVVYSVYRYFDSDFGFFKNSAQQETVSASATPAPAKQSNVQQSTSQQQTSAQQQIQDLSNICRKAVNIETPECSKWFDDISKARLSVSSSGEVTKDTYNPSKPFQTMQVEYEVTAKPVFAGCMKKGNKYVAYTQQGTILHDVSSDDCRRVIENGERPFNYFQEQQQQLQAQQQPEQQKLTSLDAEFLAKYQAAKEQGLI